MNSLDGFYGGIAAGFWCCRGDSLPPPVARASGAMQCLHVCHEILRNLVPWNHASGLVRSVASALWNDHWSPLYSGHWSNLIARRRQETHSSGRSPRFPLTSAVRAWCTARRTVVPGDFSDGMSPRYLNGKTWRYELWVHYGPNLRQLQLTQLLEVLHHLAECFTGFCLGHQCQLVVPKPRHLPSAGLQPCEPAINAVDAGVARSAIAVSLQSSGINPPAFWQPADQGSLA